MRYFLVKGIFSIILLTMLTSAVLFFCLVKNSADKNRGVSNKYADVSAVNAESAASAGALLSGSNTFPQDKANKADAEIRFRSVGNAYRGGVGSKKTSFAFRTGNRTFLWDYSADFGIRGSDLEEKLALAEEVRELGFNAEITMYYVFPSLKTKVAEIRAAVERAPVSASASLTDKNGEASFSFTKEKSGVVVNADKLCCLLFIALKNGSDSIAVPLDEKEAEVRLSELMQDTHERGSFSTVFAGGEARRHNIALAAKSVCGVSVAPGEVFSFNRTVGRRTTERGYKNAPVIYKGEYTEGVGGGVCQVSTTLYNAVLLGDLPVRERNRHTLRSRYVEPGFDAMVTDAGADLRFVNNTPGYIYIYASVRENVLTVKIYGRENIYEIERESRIIEEYKNGSLLSESCLIYRVGGEFVKKVRLHGDYYYPESKQTAVFRPHSSFRRFGFCCLPDPLSY